MNNGPAVEKDGRLRRNERAGSSDGHPRRVRDELELPRQRGALLGPPLRRGRAAQRRAHLAPLDALGARHLLVRAPRAAQREVGIRLRGERSACRVADRLDAHFARHLKPRRAHALRGRVGELLRLRRALLLKLVAQLRARVFVHLSRAQLRGGEGFLRALVRAPPRVRAPLRARVDRRLVTQVVRVALLDEAAQEGLLVLRAQVSGRRRARKREREGSSKSESERERTSAKGNSRESEAGARARAERAGRRRTGARRTRCGWGVTRRAAPSTRDTVLMTHLFRPSDSFRTACASCTASNRGNNKIDENKRNVELSKQEK